MVTRLVKWSTVVVAVALAMAVTGSVPATAAAGSDTAAAKERPALVDVNTASAAELEKLPGIGPALAKRIIEFRDKNGPFGSVDDLLKVQGIGEKSLVRFREFITASKPQKK